MSKLLKVLPSTEFSTSSYLIEVPELEPEVKLDLCGNIHSGLLITIERHLHRSLSFLGDTRNPSKRQGRNSASPLLLHLGVSCRRRWAAFQCSHLLSNSSLLTTQLVVTVGTSHPEELLHHDRLVTRRMLLAVQRNEKWLACGCEKFFPALA